ncbi:MAG: hypothetical protein U1A72_08055 [Sulfuritalea sp.]|nr:hypothetical protein [Sulfuritalea sp.]
MTTATADRRPPMPPAARAFTLNGVVLKKLEPGAAGTKRLAARFDNALVCVRYRDDPTRGRRMVRPPAQALAATTPSRAQTKTRRSRHCGKCLDIENGLSPHLETNFHIWKKIARYGSFSVTSTSR